MKADKFAYRASLNECKKYLKLTKFANEVGVSNSSLSYFLKGSQYDHLLSIDKLETLCNHISSYCEKIRL